MLTINAHQAALLQTSLAACHTCLSSHGLDADNAIIHAEHLTHVVLLDAGYSTFPARGAARPVAQGHTLECFPTDAGGAAQAW